MRLRGEGFLDACVNEEPVRILQHHFDLENELINYCAKNGNKSLLGSSEEWRAACLSPCCRRKITYLLCSTLSYQECSEVGCYSAVFGSSSCFCKHHFLKLVEELVRKESANEIRGSQERV